MRFNGKLAWGAKVPNEFREKILEVGDLFLWSEEQLNWLMACMAFESAETFSPSVKNAAGSGATGLIQFMPSTAESLGTSVGALAQMSAVRQLDYVVKYFQPYHQRVKTLSDMYMAILMPKYVGKPENSVLFAEGVAYRQNSGLDANKDGVVTKEEAAKRVSDKLAKGLRSGFCFVYEEFGGVADETPDGGVPVEAPDATLPPVQEMSPEVVPIAEQSPAPVEEIPILTEEVKVDEETNMSSVASTIGKGIGSILSISNPVAGAIFTTISSAIPELKKLWDGDTPVSERNIGTVKKVVEIAQNSIGAVNAQEMQERVIASKEDAQTVRSAIQSNWFELVESGGGIVEAAKRDKEFREGGKNPFRSPALIISLGLMLFPILAYVDLMFLHPAAYTDEMKMTLLVASISVLSGVMGYWIGGSFGSTMKTEAMLKK